MKTVFSCHSEVAHAWANQTATNGRTSNGNVFFRGDTIYSYGEHFPIARIIKGNGKDSDTVTLFTTRGYSVSTAKHVSYTRQACRHHTVIYCERPDSSPAYNFKAWKDDAQELIKQLTNPRNKKEYRLEQLAVIRSSMNAYAEAVKAKPPKDLVKLLEVIDTGEFAQAIAKEQAAKARAEKKREKEMAEKRAIAEAERDRFMANEFPGLLAKWRNHEPHMTFPFQYGTSEQYLRLSKDRTQVETSAYARISVETAKALWARIERKESILGTELDGYKVLGWNGVLKVGCHNIPRSEVEYIAKELGLIK